MESHRKRAKELGIYVLPMPFLSMVKIYLEDITLTQEQFYEKLGADSDISTSQPSPGSVMELWEKLLERIRSDRVYPHVQRTEQHLLYGHVHR